MFCSFFKKIGLSITLLFSSFGSMFHSHKPVKPESSITKEEIAASEFIITSTKKEAEEEVTIEVNIPVIVEKTVKEKIKELEVILDELYREKARSDKDKRKKKKELKAKREEEEYKRRNEDVKEIMNKIDIALARSPKEMPKYEKWHLTQKEMDSVIANKENVNYVSEEEQKIFA